MGPELVRADPMLGPAPRNCHQKLPPGFPSDGFLRVCLSSHRLRVNPTHRLHRSRNAVLRRTRQQRVLLQPARGDAIGRRPAQPSPPASSAADCADGMDGQRAAAHRLGRGGLVPGRPHRRPAPHLTRLHPPRPGADRRLHRAAAGACRPARISRS